MGEHIVGHSHQRVFLDKELPVLHHHGQAVHIGIDDKAHVDAALAHALGNGGEVGRDGLRRVAKVARRLAVELHDTLHAQGLEQARDGHAAHAVDGIDRHGEVRAADGLGVHQVEGEHLVDVAPQPGVVLDLTAQVIDVGIVKVLLLGQAQHLAALSVGEELPAVVQQLEGIPLAWVVAGGDDDAATGALAHHGQLGRGCGGQPDVNHIKAHARQRPHHGVEHHAPRQAGIAPDDDGAGLDRRRAEHQRGKSRCKLDDIERRETVTGLAADGAAYSRN